MNKTLKTRTSFQQNICRTCLCKITASNSVQIFSDKKFYKNQTLNQAFQDLAHIMIDPKDMLPINICLKCTEKLKQTISFKKTFEEADRTLKCILRRVKVRHKLKIVDSIASGLDAACDELKEIADEYETRNIQQIQVDVNQSSKSSLPKDYLKERDNVDINSKQNDLKLIKDIICSKNSDAIIIIEDTENSNSELIQVIDDYPVMEISNENLCSVQNTYQNSKNKNHNGNLVKSLVTKPQCSAKETSCSFEGKLSQIKNVERSMPKYAKPVSLHPRTIACDKCEKKFSSLDYLTRHQLYHSLDIEPLPKSTPQNTNSPLTLSVKPLSDLTEPGTAIHRNQNLPTKVTKTEQNYKCPTTSTEKILTARREIIKEECKYCKKSIDVDDLYSHIRREHKKVYYQERKAFLRLYRKCKECPVPGVKNAPKIIKHMMLPHEAKFGCKYCDKVFPISHLLTRHVYNTHHAKPAKPLMLCYICGKSCTSLHEHLKSHTNTKSFKCTFKDCKAVLKYKSTLDEHIRVVHKKETPYICERCGRQFKQRTALTQHIRTHMDVLPYTCLICEKGFVLRCKLKKHLLSHQMMKPYTCPVCPQTFGYKNSIEKHCRTYHPEYDLVTGEHNPNTSVVNAAEECIECTVCQKKFQGVHNLNKHNRIKHPHLYFNPKQNNTEKITVNDDSTKKLIHCIECKRNFAYEYTLKKHNRIFHPLEYFNQKQKQFNIKASIEEIIDHEKRYLNKYLN